MKIDLIDIRKLDLNLAVVFLALWREGSVTRAADRLALSQAATSAALARLRELCGDELFVRFKGGMAPTQRASAMAATLEEGLALLWDAMKGGPAFDPSTARRCFRVGMSDDFELALGVELNRRVIEASPGLSIVFRQTNRHTVERMLDAGDIELAVISEVPSKAWLVQERLGESGYACLLDAARWGIALPLTLDDFLAVPHVLVSFSGREGIVDSGLKAIGKRRTVCTGLTHFSVLPTFLCSLKAIATLPSHAAAALARVSSLQTCPVPVDLGRYPVTLASRHDSAGDPGLAWLKAQARQAFEAGVAAAAP